ncbi:MAG: site-specific recombinase [Pseudomonadota bacterium]
MLSILKRIDPDSERIDLLVELVERLRPPRTRVRSGAIAQVRELTALLGAHPVLAVALRCHLTTMLVARRHASVYTDTGIFSNDGFFTELKTRIAYRFLPPALGDVYLSDAIDQVLYQSWDYRWIRAVPSADWLALFDVLAAATPPAGARGNARRSTTLGMLKAIRTLSCRIGALGLEPRLVRSDARMEDAESPFLMQNIEVYAYLDAYARMLDRNDGEPEDARHLLVMLDQCDAVVSKVRKNALNQGTTVALTYLLLALTQSVDRMRKLLFLVDVSGGLPSAPTVDLEAVANAASARTAPPVPLKRAAAVALAAELIEAHNNKYTVRDLFADNLDLLARNVTENASRTGEHYIAESRGALRAMFLSSGGAGAIIAIMALFKILLGFLKRAPLFEAFLFSLNYSLGFMLIHLMHYTIATKQPAMTASRIASGLSSKDGRNIDLDSLAELITKVFRTQCVAVLGNLFTVVPTAYLIALGYQALWGKHLMSRDKALHLLHDISPFTPTTLFYAAIAGVCLFVSGLISGYYDNKALYTRMAQRVRQLRGLGRLLGQARLERVSIYVENNLGGLMGNFYFGILLGTLGTLGYLFGLPIDIRHVTFSAGFLATSFVALDQHMSLTLALTSVAGVLSIGAVNLLVSFGLALWVALRARKIHFTQGGALLKALGRRFVATPIDFFIGPKYPPLVLEMAASPKEAT